MPNAIPSQVVQAEHEYNRTDEVRFSEPCAIMTKVLSKVPIQIQKPKR